MGLTPRKRGRERDTQILHLVGQLNYLRPDHVALLTCGGRLRIARRRLLRLTQEGLLNRFATGRNAQFVYCLPGRRRDGVTAAHPLAVADVYCALVATRPADVAVEAFQPEYSAGEAYRADALLVAKMPRGRLAVFWEVDLGTEHVPIVAAKIGALAGYHAGGAYRDASWWSPGIVVVQAFVAPAPRVEPLRKALRVAAERHGVQVIVLDQTAATSQPWGMLSTLFVPEAATQQPVPAAQPAADPSRPKLYTPTWQRRSTTLTRGLGVSEVDAGTSRGAEGILEGARGGPGGGRG